MARKKTRDHKRQTKINFSPFPDIGHIPEATKPTKGSTRRASKKAYQDSTSEDELAQETERGLRIGMFNDRNNHSNGLSSSEEEQQVKKQPKLKSKKRRRETTLSESEGEATVVVIPRKRQRHAIKVEIESSEEDKKRKKKKEQAKSKPTLCSTQRGVARKASTPDKEEEEEEEEHTPPRSVRRKLKRRRPASDDEDEDEDEIDRANKDSASDAEDSDGADDTMDNKEQEELKEDLAFLRSSPAADSRRSTSTTLKNKRQEALEALKRRRAGANEASSSGTPVRRKTVVIDSESDSDSELEFIKEEDNDVEASDQDDSEDEKETNAFAMFQEDQDDEAIYRRYRKLTFRKLDDEVKASAGSKYTSAAWTTDFTRAIRARPRPDNYRPYSSSSSALSTDSETLPNGEKPTYNYQKSAYPRVPPLPRRLNLQSQRTGRTHFVSLALPSLPVGQRLLKSRGPFHREETTKAAHKILYHSVQESNYCRRRGG
ncbi:hypothetical protein J3E73DRAFT_435524 [Bipolaris maydis]|nr:hypothetical protein J3E73DRAFT_435524 [Bipolaris maydis]